MCHRLFSIFPVVTTSTVIKSFSVLSNNRRDALLGLFRGINLQISPLTNCDMVNYNSYIIRVSSRNHKHIKKILRKNYQISIQTEVAKIEDQVIYQTRTRLIPNLVEELKSEGIYIQYK